MRYKYHINNGTAKCMFVCLHGDLR